MKPSSERIAHRSRSSLLYEFANSKNPFLLRNFRLIPELFRSDATIQDIKSVKDSESHNAGKALLRADDKTLYLSPALSFVL